MLQLEMTGSGKTFVAWGSMGNDGISQHWPLLCLLQVSPQLNHPLRMEFYAAESLCAHHGKFNFTDLCCQWTCHPVSWMMSISHHQTNSYISLKKILVRPLVIIKEAYLISVETEIWCSLCYLKSLTMQTKNVTRLLNSYLVIRRWIQQISHDYV